MSPEIVPVFDTVDPPHREAAHAQAQRDDLVVRRIEHRHRVGVDRTVIRQGAANDSSERRIASRLQTQDARLRQPTFRRTTLPHIPCVILPCAR
jgi:hypothetical protein